MADGIRTAPRTSFALDWESRMMLARRGIDPERSYREFLAEVRVSPPPRLLRDLGLGTPDRRKANS